MVWVIQITRMSLSVRTAQWLVIVKKLQLGA